MNIRGQDAGRIGAIEGGAVISGKMSGANATQQTRTPEETRKTIAALVTRQRQQNAPQGVPKVPQSAFYSWAYRDD